MEPIAENPDKLDRAEIDAGPGAAILAAVGIRWHPALDLTRDLCHCLIASFYIPYIFNLFQTKGQPTAYIVGCTLWKNPN